MLLQMSSADPYQYTSPFLIFSSVCPLAFLAIQYRRWLKRAARHASLAQIFLKLGRIITTISLMRLPFHSATKERKMARVVKLEPIGGCIATKPMDSTGGCRNSCPYHGRYAHKYPVHRGMTCTSRIPLVHDHHIYHVSRPLVELRAVLDPLNTKHKGPEVDRRLQLLAESYKISL